MLQWRATSTQLIIPKFEYKSLPQPEFAFFLSHSVTCTPNLNISSPSYDVGDRMCNSQNRSDITLSCSLFVISIILQIPSFTHTRSLASVSLSVFCRDHLSRKQDPLQAYLIQYYSANHLSPTPLQVSHSVFCRYHLSDTLASISFSILQITFHRHKITLARISCRYHLHRHESLAKYQPKRRGQMDPELQTLTVRISSPEGH